METEWSQKWQLGFNEAKCKVLRLGSSNKGLDYQMGTTTRGGSRILLGGGSGS